jgi:hypothetical protein
VRRLLEVNQELHERPGPGVGVELADTADALEVGLLEDV